MILPDPAAAAPIPAFGLGRKSPDEKAEKTKKRTGEAATRSIQSQEAKVRAWCADNGRHLVEWGYDDLTSGGLAHRAGKDRAFSLARNGAIKEVVVAYFERWSREDEMEIIGLVNDLLRLGVVLRYLDAPDEDPSDPMYAIKLAMRAYMAHQMLVATSQKVRDELARVRERGVWCGRTPWGWRAKPDPTKHEKNAGLEPDPNMRGRVLALYQGRAKGEGWRTCGNRVGLWAHTAARIVAHEINREIVGDDLWDRANGVQRGRPFAKKRAYLFRGLVRCWCGATMAGNARRDHRPPRTLRYYYLCNSPTPHRRNVNHIAIVAGVREALAGVAIDAETVEAVRARLDARGDVPDLTSLWLTRRKEIADGRATLARALRRGRMPDDVYDAQVLELDAEEAALGPAPLEVAETAEAIEILSRWDELLSVDVNDYELTAAAGVVLERIIDRIVVRDGAVVEVVLNKVFQHVVEQARAA